MTLSTDRRESVLMSLMCSGVFCTVHPSIQFPVNLQLIFEAHKDAQAWPNLQYMQILH